MKNKDERIRKIADAIVKKLEEKKAFRTNLPFHLDRHKFLSILRKDVREVLTEML